MRMNGSDSRRSRRVCNSRNGGAARKRRSVKLAGYVGLALVLLCGGCGTWTSLEFYNEGREEVFVDVQGIVPDPSVGFLVVRDKPRKVPNATSNFADPVHIAETVRIIWSLDGLAEKHVVEFTRAELGVGERVRGGTFRFVYHGGEKWTVDYDPRRVE
jgi:hypothetical protein